VAQLSSGGQVADAAASAAPPTGLRAALLVLAGASMFGTVGTAQILGPDVPATGLAAARLLLGAALLLGIAVALGHAAGLGVALRHAPTWWAGVGQAAFNVTFLGAMREAGVALGTLLAIGATPVLTGLVTRQVSRRWLVATGVAVAGLVLLVVGQAQATGDGVVRPSVAGVALALGASASYATYIIAGNSMAGRPVAVEPYLGAAFAIAAIVTAPFLVVDDVGWTVRPSGAVLLGYLALVPTVLAYQLFNRGLPGVRPSTASTLGLIEPVVAAVLAVLVLHERLSVAGALGAALIIAGLLMIVRALDRREPGGRMGQSPGE
jgi:drug/metabolite transporter, DME family